MPSEYKKLRDAVAVLDTYRQRFNNTGETPDAKRYATLTEAATMLDSLADDTPRRVRRSPSAPRAKGPQRGNG
jgi:hypothetical protein